MNRRHQGQFSIAPFLVLAFCSCSTMTPSIGKVSGDVEPTSEPKAKLVLRDISAPHGLETVRDVRLRFLDAPVNISLKDAGNGTWEADLNAQQVSILAPSGRPTPHTGKISVSAESMEGTIETEEKSIDLVVSPNSSEKAR